MSHSRRRAEAVPAGSQPTAALDRDPYRKVGRWYDWLVEPAAGRNRAIGYALCPPRPGLRVLDMGCGTGTQLAVYQRAGCPVAGVDTSPAMLALARRKLGQDADLRRESAAQTSFASGTFDLVNVVLVLHELPARLRGAVLDECARVVREDGAIVVADFRAGPYAFPTGWIYEGVILALELIIGGRQHFAHYRHFIAQRGLPPLFAAAHLRVADARVAAGGTTGVYLVRKGAA